MGLECVSVGAGRGRRVILRQVALFPAILLSSSQSLPPIVSWGAPGYALEASGSDIESYKVWVVRILTKAQCAVLVGLRRVPMQLMYCPGPPEGAISYTSQVKVRAGPLGHWQGLC